MKFRSKTVLTASVIVLAFQVQAETETFSDGWKDINGTLDFTDWSHTLELPKFDPGKGVLTHVNISILGHWFTEGTVTNNIPPGGPETERDLEVKQSLSFKMDLSPIPGGSPDFNFKLEESEVFKDVPGGETRNLQGVDKTVPLTWFSTTPEELAYFTGNETMFFPTIADGDVIFAQDSGNFASNITTKAGARISITYDFVKPTDLSCNMKLDENGINSLTVSVSPESGESCGNVEFTETLSCTDGDLTLQGISADLPTGCALDPTSTGTNFTINCSNMAAINPGGNVDFSFVTALHGTFGSCTAAVSSMTCETTSSQQIINASLCTSSFSKGLGTGGNGPVPVPTLSEWSLLMLSGLLGFFGFRKSYRRI